MPVVREYEDGDGYYIRAYSHNSEGPITLQLESPEGYSIIEDYGLDDGDEMLWDTIKILSYLDLIYTKNHEKDTETIIAENFEPDPDKLEKTALTKQDLKDLKEAIRKNIPYKELSHREVYEICSMLGIKTPDDTQFYEALIEVDYLSPEKASEIVEYKTIQTILGHNIVRKKLNDMLLHKRNRNVVINQNNQKKIDKHSNLEEGEIYTGIVDHISKHGNGIIELEEGYINLGSINNERVDEKVKFKYKSGQSGENLNQ